MAEVTQNLPPKDSGSESHKLIYYNTMQTLEKLDIEEDIQINTEPRFKVGVINNSSPKKSSNLTLENSKTGFKLKKNQSLPGYYFFSSQKPEQKSKTFFFEKE